MESPSRYNISHGNWRPFQLDSVHFCLDTSGFAMLEAPTGSGKTALPAAVSSKHSVVSLVRTKALQVGNYEGLYGFAAHYGKSNYKCVHFDAMSGAMADMCLFESEMYRCPQSNRCPYLLSKSRAWNSPKASLNYAYWMLAHNWREKNTPQFLFCDECHNLSDIVTSFVSCTVSYKQIKEWSLPEPPTILHRCANVLLRLPPPVDLAMPWLQDARDVMATHYKRLRQGAQHDSRAQKRLRKCVDLGRKIRNCLDALRLNDDEWFIRSGPDVQGVVIKPLTAKFDFARFFLDGHNTIAMSATIGQPETFTKELGITDYQFRVVPSRFSPERRPVHVLDCPPMSSKATGLDFEHQADAIAKFVKQYPPHWCGLIHVTRKREEPLLCQRLAKRGLADRVWHVPGKVESYVPTDAQLKAWEKRKQRVPNSLLITCSFGEGYDGLAERINISAKIPYRRWGSEESYDRAWAKYNYPQRYNQDAAIALMQAQGRNRRGREVDYDTPDEARGANAVADGSFGKVESYLSESFREALIHD